MRETHPILAVVLAAGRSSRMGAPKSLLDAFGEPLIARHVRLLAAHGRVRVVLGWDPEPVRAVLPDGVACVDPSWAHTDMASRVRFGTADHDGPALIVPVDTFPEPDVLAALIAAGPPAVPLDVQGRRGHPAFLDRAALARLRAETTATLRDVLDGAVEVPTSSRVCAEDFDDPAAWERVRAALS